MRLAPQTTQKLYVNGAFVRSEAGRVTPGAVGETNLPVASRKDARDALKASIAAADKLAATDPLLRGQIVYRFAEMLELHRGRFVAKEPDIDAAVDAVIRAAGWADKVNAVLGEVCSPAAGTTAAAEMVGVGSTTCLGVATLKELCAAIAIALSIGNSINVVPDTGLSRDALALGEVLACSDVPSGAVNILTGFDQEVAVTLAVATGTRGLLVTEKMAPEFAASAATHLARVELVEHLTSDRAGVSAVRWQVDARTIISASGW